MNPDSSVEKSSLVELSNPENIMLVPKVVSIPVVSEDSMTVGRGNIIDSTGVFDRDTLIATYTIASTDTPYVNLTGLMDPWALYLSDALIVKYLSPYRQVACDLILTFRLVVPGACYGAYNVQCLCDGGADPGAYEIDGPSMDAYPNSTQDVHTFLNIDLKNDAVFHLPWENNEDSVRVNNTDYLTTRCWRVLIWALSPIQNTISTTVATGTIQVYARMGENRRIENLVYQGKKKKKGTMDTRYPVPESEDKTISSYSGMASRGLGILGGMFPVIAPMAAPAAAGLAAFSSFADAMGFTRESAPDKPTPTVRKLCSALPNYDGLDASEIVSLSTANYTTVDPAPGGGTHEDPMSNASLFDRWTICRILTITTTSTGVIAKIPVTPYVLNSVLGVSYMTTGGFVGLPFNMWRGGMEYMVYIPSSPNIQGSLQVLWDPAVLPGVYVADPTNRLSNVIIDLKGTTRTVIGVDYAQERPSLLSYFHPNQLVTTGEDQINGTLVFRMAAPLTAPRATGYSIQVIIMARPKQDMRFGMPGTTIIKSATAPKQLSAFRYQSGESGEEDAPVMVVQLTKGSFYPTTEVLWGEEILSTRALCQHFTPYYKADATAVGAQFLIAAPHTVPPPNALNGTVRWADLEGTAPKITVPFTYVGYYSAAFTGVRGSTRYKLFGTLTNNALMWPQPPGYINPLAVQAVLVPELYIYSQQEVSPGVASEFLIPSYGGVKYVRPRYVFDLLAAATTRVDLRMDCLSCYDQASHFGGYVSVAAGPDFTVTRFRRVPGFIW